MGRSVRNGITLGPGVGGETGSEVVGLPIVAWGTVDSTLDEQVVDRMSLRIDNDMEMPVAHAALAHPDTLLTWLCPEETSRAVACFEYIGRTALVLRGPYTGQRYWFKGPGARLTVDARDQHALSAVPVLRLVCG